MTSTTGSKNSAAGLGLLIGQLTALHLVHNRLFKGQGVIPLLALNSLIYHVLPQSGLERVNPIQDGAENKKKPRGNRGSARVSV